MSKMFVWLGFFPLQREEPKWFQSSIFTKHAPIFLQKRELALFGCRTTGMLHKTLGPILLGCLGEGWRGQERVSKESNRWKEQTTEQGPGDESSTSVFIIDTKRFYIALRGSFSYYVQGALKWQSASHEMQHTSSIQDASAEMLVINLGLKRLF